MIAAGIDEHAVLRIAGDGGDLGKNPSLRWLESALCNLIGIFAFTNTMPFRCLLEPIRKFNPETQRTTEVFVPCVSMLSVSQVLQRTANGLMGSP